MTLVEMLVATAMCIAGMWMLTWMFQQATNSFSLANAQATLTGHERLVTTLLTRDIDQDHFLEDDTVLPNRGRRVSDFKGSRTPQRGGYFVANSKAARVKAGANLLEGPQPPFGNYTDLYGYGSARSTDHFVQFTTVLQDTPGNRYYSEVLVVPDPYPPAAPTPLPPVLRTTAGTAAEISYYLRGPTGTTPNGVPLFDLMRVQRIVALGDYDKNDYLRDIVTPGYRGYPSPTPPVDNPSEVMVCTRANAFGPGNPAADTMFTLRDLGGLGSPAVWTNFPRFTPGLGAARTTGRRIGEDRLMANVVSFEVKFSGDFVNFGPVSPTNPAAWPDPSNGDTITPPSPNMWPRPLVRDPTNPEHPAGYQGNSDYPYDNLPDDGRLDLSDWNGAKASANGQPTRRNFGNANGQFITIRGIQIRIRAISGGTTRQTTLALAL